MMAKSFIPFGLLPPSLAPGWMLPGSGGFFLYRGQEPTGIDYATPVGFAAGDADCIRTFSVSHVVGQRYDYGIRRISDAGIEERNTHVQCSIVRPALGQPIVQALPRPIQLQHAWVQGQCRVMWLLEQHPGMARPEACEVLRLDQGIWQMLATVAVRGADTGVMHWRGSLATPAVIAVRSRLQERCGPLSAPLTIGSPVIPMAPQRL